jgi:hypothetical protein
MIRTLDSAWAKVDRAKEHLAELKSLVDEFHTLHRKVIIFDYDSNAGKYFANVTFPDEPPLKFSVIVGDIAHNLRSALDHLAFQFDSALPASRKFPVYSEKGKLLKALKQGLSQRFPRRAWAIIDKQQPCHYGDHYYKRGIYRLHRINIRDKHQLLNLICTILPLPRASYVKKGRCGIKLTLIPTVPPLPLRVLPTFRVKPGPIRVTARTPYKGPNFKVQVKFAFDVGIDEPDFVYLGPAITFVEQMVNATEKILQSFVRAYPSLKR